jgi:hypothetical protein
MLMGTLEAMGRTFNLIIARPPIAATTIITR